MKTKLLIPGALLFTFLASAAVTQLVFHFLLK
jgi:hypothetical protein